MTERLIFAPDVRIEKSSDVVRIAKGKLDVHLDKKLYERTLQGFEQDIGPLPPELLAQGICRDQDQRERYDEMLGDLVHDKFLVPADSPGKNEGLARPLVTRHPGGPDPVFIGLTGPGGGFQMRPAKLLEHIGWTQHPTIILRDWTRYFFVEGVSLHLNSFSKLHAWVEGYLAGTGPSRGVHVMGVGHGCQAAMVLGHAIKADRVTLAAFHHPHLEFAEELEPDYEWNMRTLLDLSNEHTKYELYFNSNVKGQAKAAQALEGGEDFTAHPVEVGEGSNIVQTLMAEDRLRGIFN